MFREEELKALGIVHLEMCGYDTCHRVSQDGQWQRNEQTAVYAWVGLGNSGKDESGILQVWYLAQS